MMLHRAFAHGFSLIELMIAIVIFSFLILLAAPMYTEFIGNSYIRNAAEAVLNGIRLAQTQAIKVNTSAAFVLDPATGWTIHAPDPNDASDKVIETYIFNEGASRATITPDSGTTTVTFDGLGRLLPNADASAQMTQIDITNTNVPTPHPLRVVVNTIAGSSGIKLCDPALASTDPAGCP
jgi:type IV fimbrial biogenesis protein FimT